MMDALTFSHIMCFLTNMRAVEYDKHSPKSTYLPCLAKKYIIIIEKYMDWPFQSNSKIIRHKYVFFLLNTYFNVTNA